MPLRVCIILRGKLDILMVYILMNHFTFSTFLADVSSDVIEGFIKNRKVDYFDLVGPGTFILDMTFQKVRIRHYSIWFSDIIVDEEIVYRKPDPAIGRIMNVGEFSMNIDIIFRLGDDEIIVEV